MVDQTYIAIPTDVGLTKIQEAMFTGVDLELTTMAYGDGGGSYYLPTPTQTSLVNPLGTTNIRSQTVDTDTNITWFYAIIDADLPVGIIREIGLYDADGDLCFIANTPEIQKVETSEGTFIDIPIELGVKNSYAEYITIPIPSSDDYATRIWVNQHYANRQLSNLELENYNGPVLWEDFSDQDIDTAREVVLRDLSTGELLKPYEGIDSNNFADKDLNNLTSFGNARLQYQPFAINSGTVDANGENATLSTGVSYKKYNFVEQGTLTKNDGVISGFSSSNYGKLSSNFEQTASTADSWDYQIVFTTGNDISSDQYVFGNYEHITNPTAWWGQGITVYNGKIAFAVAYPGVYLYTTATANTTYLVQCGYNSLSGYYFKVSNDMGVTWINEQNSTNTTKMRWESNSYITALGVNGNLRVGGQPFNGSIDLNSCYINVNGNSFWRGVVDGTSSDYDFTVGGSSDISCDPCVITTADGRTKEFTTTTSLNISGGGGSMYVEQTFVQPTLTADGTMGTSDFACTCNHGTAYYAFDNNGSTYAGVYGGNSYTCELTFYNKYPLKITQLTILESALGVTTLEYSDDNSTWTQVDTITYTPGAQRTTTWTLTNDTGFHNYYRFTGRNQNGTTNVLIYQVDITGTEQIEVAGGSMYVETEFVQPTLSSNGTLGGDSFAVSASYEYGDAYAYKGMVNIGAGWLGPQDNDGYYIFYNPDGLKVYSITFSQIANNYIITYTFWGSNDGTTWTQIGGTYNHGEDHGYGKTEIINSNTFYKYHKIQSTWAYTRTAFNNLEITATYMQEISGGDYSIFKSYENGELSLIPDFSISTTTPINVNTVGTLDNNNGIISGFSSTSWANLPSAFSPSTNNWTVRLKFKTSTFPTIETNVLLDSSQAVYEPFGASILDNGILETWGYSNNSSTEVFRITGTTTLLDNTDYYIEISYNSTSGYALKLSTDGETFTTEGTSATTTPITGGYKLTLGADFTTGGAYNFGAFQGSIDLNESYININDIRFWSGANSWWLDNSQLPLALKHYSNHQWIVDNNKVFIGKCTISGGVVTALTNRRFNHGWNIETPHIVETYVNGTSWYRVYSDGWCEQGGQIASVRTTIVNFLKPFVNNKYTAHVTNISDAGGGVPGCALASFTTNSMTIAVFNSTGVGTGAVDWSAYGYIR